MGAAVLIPAASGFEAVCLDPARAIPPEAFYNDLYPDLTAYVIVVVRTG